MDGRVKYEVKTETEFSYSIVIHQSYNIPQKVCSVSSESDLNWILKKWQIAKPGLLFSFCAGVEPNDKIFKDFLVETIRLTGAAITVEEPSRNDLLKKVVKGIARESDFTPSTIGIVSTTKNDMFVKLHEKKSIELSGEWTTLSHCTHLIFVQSPYESGKAFSFLNKSISGDEVPITADEMKLGNEGPAPVVVFMDPENKHTYTEMHTIVYYSNKNLSEIMEHFDGKMFFGESNTDLALRLIDAFNNFKPKIFINTILKLAVVLKTNNGIAAIMAKCIEIGEKDRIDLMAYAFRTDNWSQAMAIATGECQETTGERQKTKKKEMRKFFKGLLFSLHTNETMEGDDRKSLGKICDKYSVLSGVKLTVPDNTQDYPHILTLCLFLWAIINQRFSVANGLWRQTKNIMVAALLANTCLQGMKEGKTTAVHELEIIESMAGYYNKKALDILTKCSRVKIEHTKKILVRKRNELGGVSLLQIAKYNMQFIAHDACHSKVNEIWFSPLEPHPTFQLKCFILVCVFFPFLAPILNFRRVKAVQNGNEDCKEDDCDKHRSKMTQYGRKIVQFLKAPIVKFAYRSLAFLIFIFFFAYDITFAVSEFAWNDGIVIAFVLSFVSEEIRQVYQEGRHYLRNVWNWIDISSLALFISGQSLTFTACCSESGRVLLAVSFIMFSIRLLQVFSCLSQIGPFLIMIAEMLVDIFYFLGILTVVVISYAVSSRAVLYENSTFTWASIYTAFRKPYWHIFGELFLDEIEGDAGCAAAGTVTNSTEFCPSTMAQFLMPILLGAYMLIVHVLLMNLLIAKFSYTVASVHEKNKAHWRYLRYQLVDEYFNRTLIFPPFSFIYHVCVLIYVCAKKKGLSIEERHSNELSRNYDSFCVTIPQRVNTNLRNWENERAKTVFDISNDTKDVGSVIDDRKIYRKTMITSEIPRNFLNEQK